MRSRRSRNRAPAASRAPRPWAGALAVSIAFLLVAATTPGWRVLCTGPEGHASIEVAFSACCGHEGEDDAARAEPASCDGCTDELLVAPSVVAKEKQGLDSHAALLVSSVAGWLGLASPSGVFAASTPAGRLGAVSGESSTRTVVLRC